jgi:hypothetical protein
MSGWVTPGHSSQLSHNGHCRDNPPGHDHFIKLVHQCMYVQVHRYGDEDLQEVQWRRVCEKIGLDPPSEDDWKALEKWREWVDHRAKLNPGRFNYDVAQIDRKIKDTLTENRLDARRRDTLEERLKCLPPEDQVRWEEIEREIYDVVEDRLNLPNTQAEEIALLEQAVADARRNLAEARLRHAEDRKGLAQKEHLLKMEQLGLENKVPVPPSPEGVWDYENYALFKQLLTQVWSPSSSDSGTDSTYVPDSESETESETDSSELEGEESAPAPPTSKSRAPGKRKRVVDPPSKRRPARVAKKRKKVPVNSRNQSRRHNAK